MAAAGNYDDARVYRAVAAGESAEEVRHAIEADGEAAEARQLAVNKPFHETPLQAAHRLRRVDLVALLFEQGADSRELFNGRTRLTPLALAVTYGLAGTVRALLAAGHDPGEEIAYAPGYSLGRPPPPYARTCTALHLAVVPPSLLSSTSTPAQPPPPQVECLLVLLREGGANVNARAGFDASTPLHWLANFADHSASINLLVREGADIEARDDREETPIFRYAEHGDLEGLRRLLGHGASLNVYNSDGQTPLIIACRALGGDEYCERREMVLEILRRSTPRTCQAVGNDGRSAADVVVEDGRTAVSRHLLNEVVAALLAAKVPVQPANMARAMVMVASHAQRRAAELAARRSQARRWRAHETFDGLSLDAQELREAEREVEEKRRRLAELERQVFGEGTSSEDDNESGSDGGSESESDDDDDHRAKGAEGGAIEGGGGGGGK